MAARVVVLENLAAEYAERWWAYSLWPEALEADRARFWSADRVHDGFEARGLRTRSEVTRTRRRVSAASALIEAERRDASQLAVLPDLVWHAGLARLTAMAERDETLDTSFALLRVEAWRD